MELLKIWEEWARKNGYTSLTQDGIIKTMVTEFCKHLESIPMQLPVIQNANDIGLDLTLPKRMGWTEFTEDNIVFHYSTEEEYNNCENAKRLGIKVSVSV